MSSVEQRASDLLAAEYAKACANGEKYPEADEIAIRAIAAALREQPEARGVVDDDAIARVFMSLRIPFKIAAGEPITPEDWFDFGRACAALTAAQQPVQEGGGEVCDCGATCRDDGQGRCRYTAPPSAPVGVVEALSELVDLMQGVIDGEYTPDSFTLQPARAALAQQPAQAAPGDLTADEREWLDYAIEHMRDDSEPEDLTCADVLEALLQRATPPGDDAAGGECDRCGGSGTIPAPTGSGPDQHDVDVDCPTCGGTGAFQ